jgi:hypothetical protein
VITHRLPITVCAGPMRTIWVRRGLVNTDDLIGDLKQSLRGSAYAMAGNSGQA